MATEQFVIVDILSNWRDYREITPEDLVIVIAKNGDTGKVFFDPLTKACRIKWNDPRAVIGKFYDDFSLLWMDNRQHKFKVNGESKLFNEEKIKEMGEKNWINKVLPNLRGGFEPEESPKQ